MLANCPASVEGLITVRTAAHMIGVSLPSVYTYIRKGLLTPYHTPLGLLLDPAEVEAFAVERQRREQVRR